MLCPYVSNKSKASFISRTWASVSCYLKPPFLAFFLPGPLPADYEAGKGYTGLGFSLYTTHSKVS